MGSPHSSSALRMPLNRADADEVEVAAAREGDDVAVDEDDGDALAAERFGDLLVAELDAPLAHGVLRDEEDALDVRRLAAGDVVVEGAVARKLVELLPGAPDQVEVVGPRAVGDRAADRGEELAHVHVRDERGDVGVFGRGGLRVHERARAAPADDEALALQGGEHLGGGRARDAVLADQGPFGGELPQRVLARENLLADAVGNEPVRRFCVRFHGNQASLCIGTCEKWPSDERTAEPCSFPHVLVYSGEIGLRGHYRREVVLRERSAETRQAVSRTA